MGDCKQTPGALAAQRREDPFVASLGRKKDWRGISCLAQRTEELVTESEATMVMERNKSLKAHWLIFLWFPVSYALQATEESLSF
jgi:hypothetical protein